MYEITFDKVFVKNLNYCLGFMAMSLPQEREGFLTLNESEPPFSFYHLSPSETDPSFVILVWKEGK